MSHRRQENIEKRRERELKDLYEIKEIDFSDPETETLVQEIATGKCSFCGSEMEVTIEEGYSTLYCPKCWEAWEARR